MKSLLVNKFRAQVRRFPLVLWPQFMAMSISFAGGVAAVVVAAQYAVEAWPLALVFVGVITTGAAALGKGVLEADRELTRDTLAAMVTTRLARRGVSYPLAKSMAEEACVYLRGTSATMDETVKAFANLAKGGNGGKYFTKYDPELRATGAIRC